MNLGVVEVSHGPMICNIHGIVKEVAIMKIPIEISPIFWSVDLNPRSDANFLNIGSCD